MNIPRTQPRLLRVDSGEVFLLTGGETTLGRSLDCSIVVPNDAVSSRHASVARDQAGQFIIRDLGSSNGTFVNGVRVGEAHLAEGNSVSVAGAEFTFHTIDTKPPPLPIPQPPPDAGSMKAENAPMNAVKPLWHPLGITAVGIPFGFVFASVLVALNWHRLRRHGMAAFAYLFAIAYAVGVQQPLLPLFAWPWPYVVGVLVWFPILGVPQWQYVRQRVAKPYPKRSWVRVLGIGIAIQVTIGIWDRYDQAPRVSPPPVASTAMPTAGEHEYSTEELTEITQQFVVEVRATWKVRRYLVIQDEEVMAGSAVLFKATPGQFYLVTNRHVVEPPAGANEYACSILFPGAPDALPVEVLAFGKNGVDLALLRLYAPDANESFNIPMTLAKEVAPGQGCIALGNTLGVGISVTTGVISRFDNVGRTVVIRTSAPISHGNSGGGLFRLKGGTLIGITTSGRDDGQNVNFAIPVDYFAGDQSWDYLPGVTR